MFPIGGCRQYKSDVINHCKYYCSFPLHPQPQISNNFDWCRQSSRYWHAIVSQLTQVMATKYPYRNMGPVRHCPILSSSSLLLLASRTSHLDALHCRHSSPNTLAYKAQCIRLINARLSSATEALIDTTTLGAVAMLAAQEVCSARLLWNMNLYGLRLTLKFEGNARQLPSSASPRRGNKGSRRKDLGL